MNLIIMTLQSHYGGSFLPDSELKYVNEICNFEKIKVYADELYIIMLFQKLTLKLNIEKVKILRCRVNKKSDYYMLNIDGVVWRFLNNLKEGDFVDIWVVHQINGPLVVDDEIKWNLSKKNPQVCTSLVLMWHPPLYPSQM